MAQQEPRSEGAEKASPLNLMPAELAAMGKKRVEDFVNAQTELFEKFQASNKQWLDRMESEAGLASDLASKLISARSIPDAMTACQQWSNRRFEMMAEDGRHVFADAQKLVETATRLFSNGWSNGKSGSVST